MTAGTRKDVRHRPLVGFGRQLEASGLSQAEVAHFAGVSPQYINDILAGRRDGYRKRGVLAQALGCEVADLLSDEDAA